MSTGLILDLPAVLRWSENDAFLQRIETNHLDGLTSNLAFALRRISRSDQALGSELLERLKGLADRSFARLVTAPQVHFLLQRLRVRPDDEEVRAVGSFLFDCLDGEQLLMGRATRRSSAVWTALGDWYFPAGTTAADFRKETDPLVWNGSAVYCAPRLANGAVVDFVSPFGRGRLPELSGDDAPFDAAERQLVLNKLALSVVSLERASIIAARTVGRLTKVVLPRRDPGPHRQYRAASTRLCIGRPVLRNPDLPEATTAEIVDGLVHETIHCLLDMVELTEPLVVNLEAASPVVASPWTGRRLDLNTYLQACFVWYGLWNLWSRALASADLDIRSTLRYLAVSAQGFLSADIGAPISSIGGTVAPRLLDVLGDLQTTVRQGMAQIEDVRTSVL